MASRYWVGGTAAWDDTAGTKWALTSGGAGGQGVPTSADSVFFDAASGAVSVTLSGAPKNITSLNCTGFTGTLTGSTVIGMQTGATVTFVAGMTLGASTWLEFNGTGTITFGGKTVGTLVPNGGATVQTTDALFCSNLSMASFGQLNLKSGLTHTVGQIIDNTTSVGNCVLGATTTSAATLSIASGNVNLHYATISYITATGGATFTAGPGATDGGNNTGWTFLSGGTPLFELGAF
jgi:hypothetical protein